MIDLTEAEIINRLSHVQDGIQGDLIMEFPRSRWSSNDEPKSAAVLMPLLRKNSSWHVLLTRRNANLPEHSGQVAFPGGRADPADVTLEQTALREAQEEIGITPENVRLLGRLNQYITITNYLVTPIVGVIPWPYPLRLAKNEVTRTFSIPLDWLANPENHELRWQNLPEPHPPISVIYFKPYKNELLWGASARFVLALIQALNPD